MRVLSVVGARPQFVKLGPVAKALYAAGDEHVIVHTGQHYDAAMSDVFFRDLEIPAPDVHLGVGSGTHGAQTGAMLAGLDPVLMNYRPEWVLVYGDTNSTIAGALSAVKLHLPLAHLEAGLRSFNRRMPEEHNRVLTDHAADLCLAPTDLALSHLAAEGLGDRTVVTGDVMVDVCLAIATQVVERSSLHSLQAEGEEYVLATIHRAENTDDPGRLQAIVSALAALPYRVFLTVHPRLRDRAQQQGISLDLGSVQTLEPLDYPAMVMAVKQARAVVTDSGGLQKEAFVLRVPCTTIRSETEWMETLDGGWNVLVQDVGRLAQEVGRAMPTPTLQAPYGDGHSAARVVEALRQNTR